MARRGDLPVLAFMDSQPDFRNKRQVEVATGDDLLATLSLAQESRYAATLDPEELKQHLVDRSDGVAKCWELVHEFLQTHGQDPAEFGFEADPRVQFVVPAGEEEKVAASIPSSWYLQGNTLHVPQGEAGTVEAVTGVEMPRVGVGAPKAIVGHQKRTRLRVSET